jgi:hypothetical protein
MLFIADIPAERASRTSPLKSRFVEWRSAKALNKIISQQHSKARAISLHQLKGSNSWSTQSLKLRRRVCRHIVLCSNFRLNLCVLVIAHLIRMVKGKNDQSLIASLMSGFGHRHLRVCVAGMGRMVMKCQPIYGMRPRYRLDLQASESYY